MHESPRTIAVLNLMVFVLLTAGCTSGRLGQAILDGDTETVQRLLDQGADPNLSIVETAFLGVFLDGNDGFDVIRDKPFLTTAVELGHVEIARALLEAGADPNIITDAPSPLSRAGWGGHEVELTKLLLEHGADPNLPIHPRTDSGPIYDMGELEAMLLLFPITDDHWYTEQYVSNCKQHQFGPLISALTDMRRRHEYPFVADALAEFPLLTRAVLLHDDDRFHSLLEESPKSVDERDRYGFTALMWSASRLGRPTFVQPLLDAGADVNAKGDGQWTALHSAIEADDGDIIRLLCAFGADPNHRIHYQRPRMSTLMLAAQYRHADTFRALLESGADPLAELVTEYSRSGLLDGLHLNRTVDAETIRLLAIEAVERARGAARPSVNEPED